MSLQNPFLTINIWFLRLFFPEKTMSESLYKYGKWETVSLDGGSHLAGTISRHNQTHSSLLYTHSFPSISPPLSLCLFSTLSFYPLPSCFLSGLSLNTNNFFWQSIYGEVDWCVWGVGVFPKIHTIKRKHKHTLMLTHAQRTISHPGRYPSGSCCL